MTDELIPDVRSVRLGLELRRIRLERNLTLNKAHEILKRSSSSISRIEKGQVRLPERDLPPILDAYGVTDPSHRENLLKLACRSRKKDWWSSYGEDLKLLPDVISLENETTRIRSFETLFMPGLLQTRHYASELFAMNVPARKVQKLTKIRMRRQEILEQRNAPALHAILTEGALRQLVGGAAVMKEQLKHLVRTAERKQTVLQVLPFSVGAYCATGSFTLLTVPSLNGDVVLVDNTLDGVHLKDGDVTDRYSLAFEALRSLALPERDSVALIERLVADL